MAEMEYKDYYKILGVSRTATQGEIKKAFRKLAREHHPDVKPGDKVAEQRFKDVNEANEVLSDPAKRKQYDTLGADWEHYAGAGGGPFGPGGFGQGGFGQGPFAGGASGFGTGRGGVRYEFHTTGDTSGFSDFFRMFFGGGAAPGATSGGAGRGRTGGGSAFEDMLGGMGAQGGFADGELAGGSTGTGGGASRGRAGRSASAASKPRSVEVDVDLSLEEAFHGTARLVDIDGKRLEVQVPRGVDSGSRIRLRGKGGGSGADARDLYLVTRVRPHAVFTRSGADLTRELPVTLEEALLGGQVAVGTLKGRVLLTIPAGTQNGRMFRLTGQGMPRLKGDGVGDLYVRVRVVLPTKLSAEAEVAARAFLGLVEQPSPRSGS
jgi:curved DNA-binding protein